MEWSSFQPLVVSLAHTSLAQWLGKSTARIGWLLTCHLFGITMLLGSVVFLGLRLMGVIATAKPMAAVQRDLGPVLVFGLGLVLCTGFLIFTGGAIEYYATPWFRTKMLLLTGALAVQATAFQLVRLSEHRPVSGALSRTAGAAMLLAWLSVGFAGRAIAYF